MWTELGFKNNYLTKKCSGSEAGSYLRLLHHSTLGVRVIKKKKKRTWVGPFSAARWASSKSITSPCASLISRSLSFT